MSTINDIKQRLDIVQLISEYITLKKAGRNYKALCPFHNEKAPSFYVFPERQSWHCFGACGTGGDVFSFIMKKENLEFGEALQLLASKAGVVLPEKDRYKEEDKDKLRDRLYEINETVAGYFHHILQNTSSGERARAYLTQRGLSQETIANFHLGFSLDEWDKTQQYLVNKGYKREELLTAGLLVDREDGGTYDRFRNRLIFPIKDIYSHIVGFGARALDESLPKYMNSPQTPIFDKSSILYGIEHAKTAIKQKDEVIIVEGYMDVLTSHQHGWKNTVASMGTSLTERQLNILKRISKNIILALDADSAGKQATLRSEDVIEQAMDKKMVTIFKQASGFKTDIVIDADIRVAILPSGKDPDEIIRDNISEWDRLILNAIHFIDFSFNTITDKINLNDPREKSAVVEKLLPLLSRIKDPILCAHYRRKLAKLIQVDDKDISYALDEYHSHKRKRAPYKMTEANSLSVEKSKLLSNHLDIEEYCLALILRYPDLKPWISKLLPEQFEHIENRELLIKLKENSDCVTITERLDSSLLDYLENIKNKKLPPAIDENENIRQRTMGDCILRLQEKWLRNIESRKAEILATEAETGGIEAELNKLEEHGIEEHKHLKNIFNKQTGFYS